MKETRSVPDEEDLARLIRTSFDALPGPDAERLAAIESRLAGHLRRAPRRGGTGWVWLILLVGSAATAAWWGGELWTRSSDHQTVNESMPQQTTPADDTRKDKGQGESMKENAKMAPHGERQTPLIDRREVF